MLLINEHNNGYYTSMPSWQKIIRLLMLNHMPTHQKPVCISQVHVWLRPICKRVALAKFYLLKH